MGKTKFAFFIKLLAIFTLLSVSFMGCPPPPPEPEPDTSPPYLAVAYTMGTDIYLKETTRLNALAVFRDSLSNTRHTLVESDTPLSRPSVTFHGTSKWLAWREGSTIFARAIWWGPGRTRTVYTGDTQTPTAPAIISYNDRLIVVWGVGNTLYLSSSEYGVEWSTPLGKVFSGATVHSPALAVHEGNLFVGAAFGPSLYTIRINGDLTWGPNFLALSLDEAPIPVVSLASDGDYLHLGFAGSNHIAVIRSLNGYNNWNTPRDIESGPHFSAPPALCHYNGYLYAVYSTGVRLLMRRSADGLDWATPRFVVDANASGQLPAAALTGSGYSVVPPTPQVVTLNNSGRSAASTFNLVFISEGYLDTEMDDFRTLAGRVADTFRIVNPFSKHLDKFNMYRIDLPSREKGVDASPLLAAAVRQGIWDGSGYQAAVPTFQPRYTDTALGAQYWSCWEAPHFNSNIEETQSSPNNPRTPMCDGAEDLGNPHTRMTLQKAIHIFGYYAYDLVEGLIPGFDLSRDVLYVIVNHIPEDGGTDKASYNPVVSTPDFAEGLGNVHEMGHFMAHLDDEDFNSCWTSAATDCDRSANKTVNADLTDPSHKWAHFFVNEGRAGDSIVANPANRPPSWNTFWDPSVVNASSIFNVGLWATNGSNNWAYTGGTIVYGPAQQCLMNHTGGTSHFCPVCTEAVLKELFARAGETFVDADYHGVYDRVLVEYKNRTSTDPEYPKAGFISLNGTPVTVDKFTCIWVGNHELCSVELTPYLRSGANRLVFNQQSGVSRRIDLLSIQVVNSNGAPLPLFPITDLSSIGSAYYFTDYFWVTTNGNLEFEFTASITP
jgi:hypothetical protein